MQGLRPDDGHDPAVTREAGGRRGIREAAIPEKTHLRRGREQVFQDSVVIVAPRDPVEIGDVNRVRPQRRAIGRQKSGGIREIARQRSRQKAADGAITRPLARAAAHGSPVAQIDHGYNPHFDVLPPIERPLRRTGTGSRGRFSHEDRRPRAFLIASARNAGRRFRRRRTCHARRGRRRPPAPSGHRGCRRRAPWPLPQSAPLRRRRAGHRSRGRRDSRAPVPGRRAGGSHPARPLVVSRPPSGRQARDGPVPGGGRGLDTKNRAGAVRLSPPAPARHAFALGREAAGRVRRPGGDGRAPRVGDRCGPGFGAPGDPPRRLSRTGLRRGRPGERVDRCVRRPARFWAQSAEAPARSDADVSRGRDLLAAPARGGGGRRGQVGDRGAVARPARGAWSSGCRPRPRAERSDGDRGEPAPHDILRGAPSIDQGEPRGADPGCRRRSRAPGARDPDGTLPLPRRRIHHDADAGSVRRVRDGTRDQGRDAEGGMGDYFGWDIGGVHIKFAKLTAAQASASILTRVVPFEIWKDPDGLVVSGVLRRPPSSLTDVVPLHGMWCRVSPEHFTIMGDVYRILGTITERDYTVPTPDGRGRSRDEAMARLARLVCADLAAIGPAAVETIALFLEERQIEQVTKAILQVLSRQPQVVPPPAVSAGAGAFLAEEAARRAGLEVTGLARLATGIAGDGWPRAAPAAAIAVLLAEEAGVFRFTP